ncbi:hypothetical protein Cob_v002959 [Colletotrichum orbiculare MAFF 240422]|uniref:Uncharacterized protein n=1 Tax=Colletotrichum orbiculare (strain 104-T / ATCC 96160 / CBS 514.97 / LARS 414 / MAFF 240422) TaxID=1213857 RepID=N4V7U2_COLOR|nr:hypothetical protein Cob_v002959 [Colletotrichum orbiculare MAFF 240422]
MRAQVHTGVQTGPAYEGTDVEDMEPQLLSDGRDARGYNFFNAISYDMDNPKCACYMVTAQNRLEIGGISPGDCDFLKSLVSVLVGAGVDWIAKYQPTPTNWYHDDLGRMGFHGVLRGFLVLYRRGLDGLWRLLRSHSAAIAEDRGNEVLTQEAMSQLLDYAADVILLGEWLRYFVATFRCHLKKHLSWLSIILKLRCCRSQFKGCCGRYMESVVDQHPGSKEDGSLPQPGPSPPEDWDALLWPEAAISYLDWITSQVGSLKLLMAPKSNAKKKKKKAKRVASIVNKADFRILELVPEGEDQRMTSWVQLLNSLERVDGTKMRFNEKRAVYQWFQFEIRETKANKVFLDFDNTHFEGTCHPEMAILGLHLLAQERLRSGETVVETPEGIRLPAEEVTDLFRAQVRILAATERCCAACDWLVNYYVLSIGQRKTEVKYPGSDGLWTACSLPPWIPREAGIFMLERATRELWRRARLIALTMNVNDHLTSENSTGRQGEATNSSAEHIGDWSISPSPHSDQNDEFEDTVGE